MKKATLFVSCLALVAFVAFAANQIIDQAGVTVRYRGGAVVSIDPTVTVQDEDGRWSANWQAVQNLVTYSQPFLYKTTNYTMLGTEAPVIGLVGAHSISLPGATTNYGRTWTIIAVGSGTNAIFKPDGSTILWTNLGTGRGTRFYCDGTNWWTVAAP